jgi:3-hydroxybutyryl-CoA dehydrogenase
LDYVWSRPVAVIGAGTMGSQIAQHCALYGFEVYLLDTDSGQLDRATHEIARQLARQVDEDKRAPEDMREALQRVRPTSNLARAVGEAGFVIEAVTEDLDVKRQVFAELERVAPLDAVLASHSSTIGISRIAGDLATRSRCLNMHFYHPVPLSRLCGLMRGPDTSAETVERALEFTCRIGKEPVMIDKEAFGSPTDTSAT